MPEKPPCRRVRAVELLATALVIAGLSGCASIRVDEAGRTHVVGLVWLTLPAAAERDRGADQIRTRSVGLTLASHPIGQSAVLGYADHTLTRIEDDRVVRLPAP
jgi:hypothetical protein